MTSLAHRKEPICSICIANYNGRDVLETCINSVLQQAFSLPFEIIIHDDASTDGSAEIIAEKYPMVRLLRSNENVGFCASNNRMVSVAKGEFILLLNNDAELHEDALSTLYKYTTKENINGIIGLPQYDMQTGELIDIGSLFDIFLNPIPNKKREHSDVGMVTGACMWLSRKLWVELGGFPEYFGSIAEDTYICCRARLKGYPVIALAESGFKHWVGKSLGGGKVVNRTLQTTYRRRYLSERNKSFVMLLCYPGFLAYILIPLHLMLLTAEGFLLSIKKRDWYIWKDIYKSCCNTLWCRRRELARMRQKIQKERTVSSRSFYSMHSLIPHKLRMLMKYGFPEIK